MKSQHPSSSWPAETRRDDARTAGRRRRRWTSVRGRRPRRREATNLPTLEPGQRGICVVLQDGITFRVVHRVGALIEPGLIGREGARRTELQQSTDAAPVTLTARDSSHSHPIDPTANHHAQTAQPPRPSPIHTHDGSRIRSQARQAERRPTRRGWSVSLGPPRTFSSSSADQLRPRRQRQ